MFSTFFLMLLAVWIWLLPIYLWGYAVSYLSGISWNRRRFWIGVLIGGMSVWLVWAFSYFDNNSNYIFLVLVGFVVTIASILFILIQSGSAYARILLQKFALANMIVIFALLIAILVLSSILPWGTIIALSITPLLISSAIEESSKHLMSIGLMSHDFAFSRRDIIIFTIFVVLGFVWIENLLYFFQAHISLSTWIFRSFFSLTAHLLASVICAYAWWRAIAYEPASFRYILIFALWISLAVLTHLGYNMILREGSILWLFIYMIVGYVVVTRGILMDKKL